MFRLQGFEHPLKVQVFGVSSFECQGGQVFVLLALSNLLCSVQRATDLVIDFVVMVVVVVVVGALWLPLAPTGVNEAMTLPLLWC